MKFHVAVLMVFLLAIQSLPLNQTSLVDDNTDYVGQKSTGVDLSVSDISFFYPNAADEQKYRMFSSNYPIQNFNRPETLFVIDAVINVDITIQVTIDNYGNTDSPQVDVNMLIKHNEYQNFELHNETNQISSIRANSNEITTFRITPTYSGNHSIVITPYTTIVDDNSGNDVMQSTFTVASHYFNCDDLSLWTVDPGWGVNSEIALSQGSACHIGNGQASTYQPNTVASLTTPVMDLSDAITSPLRSNGIAYFYTGSVAGGDSVKTYSMTPTNSWTELVSISGTVDNDFSDSADWQTWSINDGGVISPIIPSPQQNFHANSQFRFGFSSDAVNNDIGLWIDDIVIVYDQELRVSEYNISAVGIDIEGTVPDSWGKVTLGLTNTGNIAETFTPTVDNLPNEWQYYFSQTTGVSITEANGIYLEKGETKVIEFNYKPKYGENQGFFPVNFAVESKTHSAVNANIALQLEVTPDRIPEFLPLTGIVSCAPGKSCVTTTSITNAGGATDVFSLSLDYSSLPLGWSVAFSWNQAREIIVQPGFSVPIMLTYTVGSDAVPDSIGSFDIIAVSQNDSTRTDRMTIEIYASMVSNAFVYPNIVVDSNDISIAPGESQTVVFNVLNNASVQDIFETNMEFNSANNWVISEITPARLYLNAGDTGSFSVRITAPTTAQVGDDCPAYTASIISERSGQMFTTDSIDNLIISQINNIELTLIDYPASLSPGSKNVFSLMLANLGNGAVGATIDVDGIPDSWSYSNNHSVTNTVQLGEISEYRSIRYVELVIDIPSGIDFNQIFDITITALPNMYGDDIDLTDNFASVSLITEVVRDLGFSDAVSESRTQYVGNGTTNSVDFKIINRGNIDESDIRIFASVTTSDYNKPIPAYMSLGSNGLAYELFQSHPITISKNSTRMVSINIMIPEDIPLGANITVEFTITSSTNAFEPLVYQRFIEVDTLFQNVITIESNLSTDKANFANFWINTSTTNRRPFSLPINYQISFTLPHNWGILCQYVDGEGVLFDRMDVGEGYLLRPKTTFNNTPYSAATTYDTIFCEIKNSGSIATGVVEVYVNNTDNPPDDVKRHYANLTVEFPTSASKSSQAISPIGVVSISLLVGVSIILLAFRRYLTKTTATTAEQTTMSGPPISGPPISKPANLSQEQTEPSKNNEGERSARQPSGPPIPESGLPIGWSIEQWEYYGQQYLDMNNRE